MHCCDGSSELQHETAAESDVEPVVSADMLYLLAVIQVEASMQLDTGVHLLLVKSLFTYLCKIILFTLNSGLWMPVSYLISFMAGFLLH